MSDSHGGLSDLEYDLLTELFNIGVGRAASVLSEMLHQEIKLSVPDIRFCTVAELIHYFNKNERLITVSQDISGAVDMVSILVFPSSNSIEVIKAMLGEHLSDEMAAEMQQEAFTEIGNIVLNACIGIIGKTLGEEFFIDLPRFAEDTPETIFINSMNDPEQIVMTMKVDLKLTSSTVSGYIAFILGSVSMDNIRTQLRRMLSQL